MPLSPGPEPSDRVPNQGSAPLEQKGGAALKVAPPSLAGLDSDDDDEEDAPLPKPVGPAPKGSLARRLPPPPRRAEPLPPPPPGKPAPRAELKSQPPRPPVGTPSRPPRPAPLPLVGDPLSDTPTTVGPMPKPPEQKVEKEPAAPPPLLRMLDASLGPQAAGAVEVTVTAMRPRHEDQPEPTITVAAELLADLGVAPGSVPVKDGQIDPASLSMLDGSKKEPEDLPRESTKLISITTAEPITRHSGPQPIVRAPSGPNPQVKGPPSLPQTPLVERNPSSPEEKTRIVSDIKLVELQEARAKRTRSQPVVGVDDPRASGPQAKVTGPQAKVDTKQVKGPPSGRMTAALARVLGDSAVAEHKKEGKQKKNLISLIKAKSKVKSAPIDPSRMLVLEEAEERKAHEAAHSGLNKFFEKSGLMKIGASLGEEGGGGKDQTEGTMIGRFLGMVGIGMEGQAAAQKQVGKDSKQETWETVQQVPFLEGINPHFLRDGVQSGDLKAATVGRDHLIMLENRYIIVVEGQVALARFNPEVLEKERRAQKQYKPGNKKSEKKEQVRRQEVGPLIRLSESNLATFNEGDLLSYDLIDRNDPGLAFYTVTPVKLLRVSAPRMETWRRTYQFVANKVRNATESGRSRIEAASGARAQVADFFVRNGISIAMTLRVRELDKCIECYECEKACEERYGVKRLSLKGKILGALDFVDCCRTCSDQRCVDVCGYDSIKFDDNKKEVLINEETCTGCSMCSMACPYDAIEMHQLDDKPLLRMRLERQNKLGFGEGKGRKAPIRRIASKCDHCVSYEDQACISACPTSALLEIPPEVAFIDRTDEMAEAARSGYDEPALAPPGELFNPEKFFKGLKSQDDKARVVERKMSVGWMWVVGLLGVLGCSVEIALRHFLPTLSLLYKYQIEVAGLDPDLALANIDFRPGSDFAVWLGYIGSVIMFSSMFYSIHKWVPGMKKLGSYQAVFDYHVWAGTIGPLFIILHSAAKMDNWVSLGIWAMVATVISGLVGRYLSTEVPDLISQAALRVLDLERQLAELRNRHAGVSAADRFIESKRREYSSVNAPGLSGVQAGILAVRLNLRDQLARPLRSYLLRRRLTGIKNRRARAQVAALATRILLLERQRLLLPRIEPIFHEWKTVHIPFAIVLTVISGIHIFIEMGR